MSLSSLPQGSTFVQTTGSTYRGPRRREIASDSVRFVAGLGHLSYSNHTPVFGTATVRGGVKVPRTPKIGVGDGNEDRFFPPAAPPFEHTEYTWIGDTSTFTQSIGDSERRNAPGTALGTTSKRLRDVRSDDQTGPGAYSKAAIDSVGHQVESVRRSSPSISFADATSERFRYVDRNPVGPGAYQPRDVSDSYSMRMARTPSFGVGDRSTFSRNREKASTPGPSSNLPSSIRTTKGCTFGTRAAWYPESKRKDIGPIIERKRREERQKQRAKRKSKASKKRQSRSSEVREWTGTSDSDAFGAGSWLGSIGREKRRTRTPTYREAGVRAVTSHSGRQSREALQSRPTTSSAPSQAEVESALDELTGGRTLRRGESFQGSPMTPWDSESKQRGFSGDVGDSLHQENRTISEQLRHSASFSYKPKSADPTTYRHPPKTPIRPGTTSTTRQRRKTPSNLLDEPLERPILIYDPMRGGLVAAKTRREAGILSGELEERLKDEQRKVEASTKRAGTPAKKANAKLRDLERIGALHNQRVLAAEKRAAREPIF